MILMPSYSVKQKVNLIRDKMESLRKEGGLSFCLSQISPKLGIHHLLLREDEEIGIFNGAGDTFEANIPLRILNQDSYSFIGISFKEWLRENKGKVKDIIKDSLSYPILGEIRRLFKYSEDDFKSIPPEVFYSQEMWDTYVLKDYFYREYYISCISDMSVFCAKEYFSKEDALFRIKNSEEMRDLVKHYVDRVLKENYSYTVCCKATDYKEVTIKDFIPFAIFKNNSLWLFQSVSQENENDGVSIPFQYKTDTEIARALQDNWYSLLPIQDGYDYRTVMVDLDSKESAVYNS